MDFLMASRRMLLLQQQQQDDDAGAPSPLPAAAGGGGVGAPSAPRTYTGFLGLLTNGCFIAATVCFALAQLAKLFTHYYTERVWNFSRLVGSGGMPSSHTAFVVGLTTAVGLLEGTGSSVFAVALVVTLIVMYDATGVRLHAGRQATVLNIIISEMPADHPVQDSGRLREVLGHTPVQVAVGAVLGVVVGYIIALQFVVAEAAKGHK